MAKFEGLIPLTLPSTKNLHNDLKVRLSLLKEADLYVEEMLTYFKKAKAGNLNDEDKKEIWKILQSDDLAFTEVDRGVLFSQAFIQNMDFVKPEVLNMLDNRSGKTRIVYGEDEKAVFRKFKREFGYFGRMLLPIRAKLAFRELAYVLLKDKEIILDLLAISLKYLSCPRIVQIIDFEKDRRIYARSGSQESKKFIKDLSIIIQGNTKNKKRTQWYWRAHYYFFEIKSCIETFNSIKDEDKKRDYLESVKLTWVIPSNYVSLIAAKSDSPTNLTLGILEAKNYIKSGSQFLKGFNKNIKKLKDSASYLHLMPEEIFSLMDAIAFEPLIFTKVDPFKYLNEVNYIDLLKNNPK